MSNQFDRVRAALAGTYDLERELGQGGMATVYLANDLKHDRQVAVKVLRPELAATIGSDRFLREVHIAASLTHPHILGLHDSGEAGDFLYYVMPFVEGESLRDRLTREGELPIHDAVRIVREVVDALAFAHERNVVHRDIKPDNVMVAGRHAMVTDFGVAKAVSEASGRQAITTAGVALGTPAYMAPEQAAADAVDHRADIYAVGALTYELLTGRPPFVGTTAQQVLAAHVREPAQPPSTLRAAIPPQLDRFVLKCLEKRAADRYQSADEMLRELEVLGTPSGGLTPTDTMPVTGVRLPIRTSRVAVVTGVTVALAVLGFLGWSSLRRGGLDVTVSGIRAITRDPVAELEPQVSPDGGEVAYVANVGFERHVLVRDLAGGRAITLTGDRPGTQLGVRWMPDGRSVAFVENSSTFVIPRFGGAVSVLVDGGTVWAVNERLLVYTRSDTLFARALAGGDSETAIPAPGEGVHSAALSPDGRRIAFVVGNSVFLRRGDVGNIARSAIWVANRETGESVAVLDDGNMNLSPAWLPDGRHLLFISNRDGQRDMYLVRLDGGGRAAGEPTRVTTGLEPASLSLSADGRTAVYTRLIFRSNLWAVPIPSRGIASVRDAKPVVQGTEILENHGISADGQWLAFDSDRGGNQDIYVRPLAGGEARRLTTDPAPDFHPDFSPDGSEIVFYSMRHGTRDLFLIRADGTGETRLTDWPGNEAHPSFSRDGLHIVYVASVPDGDKLFVISRTEIGAPWGAPRQLGPSEWGPARWSPDGREIAHSRHDGSVATMTLDGRSRTVFDAAAAGLDFIGDPVWSADGSTLYFDARANGVGAVFAVPAAGGTARPVVLIDDPRYSLAQNLTLYEGNLYVTLTEYDADVWTMELDY